MCNMSRNRWTAYKVETKETGQKMIEVSQKLPDKGMYRRLNSTVCTGDAIANDVLNHNLCWTTVKNKAEVPWKTVYTSKEIIHTVPEIEPKNLIKSDLNDPSHQILDMDKVNITYRNLLFENGLNINEICENYTKPVKILIQENIRCAKIVKSKCASQPEKIFKDEAQRGAIHKSLIDQTQDINLNYMWKVARFNRKEILDRDQWGFTGTFNDFDNPPMLHTLLKWILLGRSNHVESKTRRKGTDKPYQWFVSTSFSQPKL